MHFSHINKEFRNKVYDDAICFRGIFSTMSIVWSQMFNVNTILPDRLVSCIVKLLDSFTVTALSGSIDRGSASSVGEVTCSCRGFTKDFKNITSHFHAWC